LLLRQALNFGSFLHSHGIHFFALAGPDLLLGLDSDPAQRNIIGLLQAAPDVAKKALRLRTIGQRVTEIIGGRGTHPVSCVAGGIAGPLTKERHETLKKLVDEAVPLGVELYKIAKEAVLKQMDLVQSLPLEYNYMGTVNDGALDLYHGDLRLQLADGRAFDFSEDDWASQMFERAVSTSYAKHVYCRASGDPVLYRVGPLARLNVCDRIETPAANAELEEFRKLGGSPCHQTVMYHFARLIEILYAAEKLAQIIKDDEILSPNVRTMPSGALKSAAAHVEAPRGVLIHDYEVDGDGIVTRANLIVATQQNIASINEVVALSAQRYLDQSDELLLNGIEFGIRCYDPCLSCATHRLGEMKLDVVVRRNGEVVRRARR